jgi:amidase
MLLQIVAGPPPSGSGYKLQLPQPTKTSLREFRIAIWADDGRCPVDDALTGAAHVLAHKLRHAGAAVSMDARPDIDLDVNRKVYWQLTAANRVFGFGTDDGRVSLLQYRQAQESRYGILGK